MLHEIRLHVPKPTQHLQLSTAVTGQSKTHPQEAHQYTSPLPPIVVMKHLHINPYVCVSISPKVYPRVELRPIMNAMDVVSAIILAFVLSEFYRYFYFNS